MGCESSKSTEVVPIKEQSRPPSARADRPSSARPQSVRPPSARTTRSTHEEPLENDNKIQSIESTSEPSSEPILVKSVESNSNEAKHSAEENQQS